MANNAASTVNFSVSGNIILNSGSLDINFTSGGSGVINLKGDLAVGNTANIFANSSNTATFNFNGIGDGLSNATTQTIDVVNQTTASNITFNVNSGAYTKLVSQNLALGTNSKFNVKTGGTFDFGFDGVNGAGTNALNIMPVTLQIGQTFTTESGSTIKITSPYGITTCLLYTSRCV